MSIDLTDITDEVAKAWWAKNHPEHELTDNAMFALKGALLPIISGTAELVEAAVRREVRVKLDTLPAADLGQQAIYKVDAVRACG